MDIISSINNPVVAVIIGLLVTALLQSSSAAVGILIGMAGAGIFTNLAIANFFILGSNVGACTSALLASLSARKDAKRTAMVDICFNVTTMIVLFVLLLPFGNVFDKFVMSISHGSTDAAIMARAVANSQTTLKVLQVIIALPFTGLLVKLSRVIIRGEDKQTEACELKYISEGSASTPATCILEATREIQRMGIHATENLERAFDALINRKEDLIEQVYEVEKQVDFLNKEITQYLVKVSQSEMPVSDGKYTAAYFHVVSDIERIGDHAVNIADFAKTRINDDVHFSKDGVNELTLMFGKVVELVKLSLKAFVDRDDKDLSRMEELEEEIDDLEVQLETNHVRRMTEGKCSPKSAIFTDLVSNFERVGDHAINIGYAMFGDEK
jgi:phosphate:Na+ symporter